MVVPTTYVGTVVLTRLAGTLIKGVQKEIPFKSVNLLSPKKREIYGTRKYRRVGVYYEVNREGRCHRGDFTQIGGHFLRQLNF